MKIINNILKFLGIKKDKTSFDKLQEMLKKDGINISLNEDVLTITKDNKYFDMANFQAEYYKEYHLMALYYGIKGYANDENFPNWKEK